MNDALLPERTSLLVNQSSTSRQEIDHAQALHSRNSRKHSQPRRRSAGAGWWPLLGSPCIRAGPVAPNGGTTVVPQQVAGSGTYRRFSYEPGTEAPVTPAPVYRAAPVQRFSAPSRHWVPASELPKTDPFKYSGGRWQ